MKKNIAVSILDANDISALMRQVKLVEEKLQKIPEKMRESFFELVMHFDVMDQKFVPGKGIALEYLVEAKHLGFYTDTHLMVKSPIVDKYIDRAIDLGTDAITIHYEIECLESVLCYLNQKKVQLKEEKGKDLRIGVSVKPNTPLEGLVPYQEQFEHILIMTVEPGRGGQAYIADMNEKIQEAKQRFPNHSVQIDGGVQLDTMIRPIQLGVDSLVMGSFLSKRRETDLYDVILQCNLQKQLAVLPREENIDFDANLLQIIPGGYGEGDILLGLRSPVLRKLEDDFWKYMTLYSLEYYIDSPYHEYRKLACFFLARIAKSKQSQYTKQELVNFLEQHITSINNWDLTDIVGPHVLGSYWMTLEKDVAKQKLEAYLTDDSIWVKRMGIVSLLQYAREGNVTFVLEVLKDMLYDSHPLLQKASGWVLREAYKKDPVAVVDYLTVHQKNKKLPSTLVSYACEKMSQRERKQIKQ